LRALERPIVEVEMSSSEPLDRQQSGEAPPPLDPPRVVEAFPAMEATQPVAPQPATRQTLPARPDVPFQSRRRSMGWLLLPLVAVLLLALVGAGVALTSWESSRPTTTVAALCGALKGKNYSAVYQQLPGGAKGAQTEAAFTQDAKLQDQLDGPVRACAVVRTSKDTNAWSQAPQAMTLQVARNHNYSGALTLNRDGLGWRIGALDTLALGPVVGPWAAAQRFCAALTAGDFAAAYGALSRQGQANASQAQFTKAFSDALASSKARIASCQLDAATYAAQPAAASVVATLTVQTTTVNGAVSAPVKVKFSLVSEADAWKLDGVQPFSGS
jgi:hypothetical protein